MTILLVYYSRTGLTEKAALEISKVLACDREKVGDIKSRAGVLGYLRSGKEAMKKMLPEIMATKYNPSNYDLVVIGTPNWAGHMSSPIRAYLSKEKSGIKKFAIFLTQGGRGVSKAIEGIEELLGSSAAASTVLFSKEVADGSFVEKMNIFIEQLKKLRI